MAENGSFGVSDHTQSELITASADPKTEAATMIETNAHGGRPQTYGSISNYGFLDGHAETIPLKDVIFHDGSIMVTNRLDPSMAQ